MMTTAIVARLLRISAWSLGVVAFLLSVLWVMHSLHSWFDGTAVLLHGTLAYRLDEAGFALRWIAPRGGGRWLLADAAFEPLIVALTGASTFLGLRGDKLASRLVGARTSSSRAETRERVAARNRRSMLEKMRATWIEGVLLQSLSARVRLAVGKKDLLDDAVHRVRIDPPGLPSSDEVVGDFDRHGGRLLILGVPGGGKTTMLLELARSLLDRAAQDPNYPIPVVFPLSTWAKRRLPVQEWLVAELQERYAVPAGQARAWVDAEEILPLLDGLDEVSADRRKECVQAIETFRREHGLLPMVVCSRFEEYASLNEEGADLGMPKILLQSLRRTEVNRYLDETGSSLDGLRVALAEDPDIWKFAINPLLLAILTVAYEDKSAAEVRTIGNPEQRRDHLFAAYADAMFHRRGNDAQFPRTGVLAWLSWLAQIMLQQSQTVFYIEHLQSKWVPVRSHREWLLAVMASGGFAVGLGAGILLGKQVAFVAGIVGAILCLLYAAGGLKDNLKPVEKLVWLWEPSIDVLRNWQAHLSTSLLVVVPSVIVAGAFGGWRAVIAASISTAIVGSVFNVVAGGGGIGDLDGHEVESRIAPAQGVWQSFRNSLIVAALSTLFCGTLSALLFQLLWTPLSGARLQGWVPAGLVLSFGFGVGLLMGLVAGGLYFCNHIALRVLLWKHGMMPWRLVRFLDYSSELNFLHKVGGGYIFVHRLLMEYFASLPEGKREIRPE